MFAVSALLAYPWGGARPAGAESAVESTSAPPAPSGDAVTAARRLIDDGRPEAAYRLLGDAMEQAPAGVDAAAIRFTAAQALLAGGHLSQAAQLLGQLAADRPELDRVRLEYAAVLFALGRDDEAAAAFRATRRLPGMPEEARRAAEAFLERIRARRRWRLDFDAGFWRDDNVNNAPESESVAVPAFGGFRFRLDERPVRAWVAHTGARLRWRESLGESGRVFVESHAALARDTAIGAAAHNRARASLSAGPRIGYALTFAGRPQAGLLRADIGAERRWRGGDGYAARLWAGAGVEQTLAPGWRAGVSPRIWLTRYDGGGKPRGASLDLFAARRAGPGWLTAGARLSRETSRLRMQRWRSRAASLGYAAEFGRNWSVALRAAYTRTRFDAEQWLFGARREDRAREASLTLSHRALAWEGYLPELIAEWSRVDSNIPLYDRELRTLRLNLRRLFRYRGHRYRLVPRERRCSRKTSRHR